MRKAARAIALPLCVVAASFVAAVVYGFAVSGGLTPAYVFPAGFIAGALMICAALAAMIFPSVHGNDRLCDHSTFMERGWKRRKKAYQMLLSGIAVTMIVGSVQLLLSLVIPGG